MKEFEPPLITHKTLLNFLNSRIHSLSSNDCYYERYESTIFTSSHFVNFYLPQLSGLEKEIANTLLNNQKLLFKPTYFTMNGKMTIPLRGTQCTHIDTVDIDRFIVENYYRYEHFWKFKSISKWICPICKKKMPLNSIRISKWVKDNIEFCEQNGIKNFFITYDLQNRKFKYFEIKENVFERSLDNFRSKIFIKGSSDNINSSLSPQSEKNSKLVFYNTQSIMDISKMKISQISNEMAILNYFVSDNKAKFVINFDFPSNNFNLSNDNQYYGVIIAAYGTKRIKIFDLIKNEIPFPQNGNNRQIKIFPCPLQPDFRYITFARILYKMFPQMKFVFYYQCSLAELNKIKKEILSTNYRLTRDDIDISLDEPQLKVNFSEYLSKSMTTNINQGQNNKRFLNQNEFVESIKKYFIGDYRNQGSYLNEIYQMKNKTFDNPLPRISIPLYTQNSDNISISFYENLKSNSLSLIENMSTAFYINIGFISIQKLNYEQFFLTELSFSNSLIVSLSNEQEDDNNTEVPLILLSYRNLNYKSFAMLNPPNFDNNSSIFKDIQLTNFHYGILFFLCHAICIDFYGTNRIAEMELLDQYNNMKKEYPSLITKPLLIFCRDKNNFNEIMEKLGIQVSDGISCFFENIQYFPIANAYIWPKEDNYKEEMIKDASIYNLLQRHGPFKGKQFISKKAKKIAGSLEFIFQEFSKYEIAIRPLDSSIDTYNFSLKAREYPD